MKAMKTKISNFLLMAAVSVLLLTPSCSEENDDFLTPGPPLPENELIGQIVDFGPVTDFARHMTLTLFIQGEVNDSNSGLSVGKVKEISLDVFVNEDGFIPDGIYSFSATDTKELFTFVNGTAMVELDGAMGEIVPFLLSDGILELYRSGDDYILSLEFILESGQSVSVSASGGMTYEDKY